MSGILAESELTGWAGTESTGSGTPLSVASVGPRLERHCGAYAAKCWPSVQLGLPLNTFKILFLGLSPLISSVTFLQITLLNRLFLGRFQKQPHL